MARGTCDGCGLPKELNQDGMIRKHKRRRGWSGYNRLWADCPGGGKPPRRSAEQEGDR